MADEVNHPDHYTRGGVEIIDVIEQIVNEYKDPATAWCVGNVIKYLARAPLKGKYSQDLQKANWYLSRVVDKHAGPKEAPLLDGGDTINLAGVLSGISNPVSSVPPYGNLGDD